MYGILCKRRARELIAFISSYRQLSKLAPALKERVDLTALVAELPLLFSHRVITLNGPCPLMASLDRVQIHQLLINLIKNAEPNGTGIGLILCRQIAESHGGYLSLENSHEQTGCKVTINLPLQSPA